MLVREDCCLPALPCTGRPPGRVRQGRGARRAWGYLVVGFSLPRAPGSSVLPPAPLRASCFVPCCHPPPSCLVLPASCQPRQPLLLPASRLLPATPASCFLPATPASCRHPLPPPTSASCFLPPAFCLLRPARPFVPRPHGRRVTKARRRRKRVGATPFRSLTATPIGASTGAPSSRGCSTWISRLLVASGGFLASFGCLGCGSCSAWLATPARARSPNHIEIRFGLRCWLPCRREIHVQGPERVAPAARGGRDVVGRRARPGGRAGEAVMTDAFWVGPG